MSILVTGAAGFIGSNLVRHLLSRWPTEQIVSFDALTYSGNVANLEDVYDNERHTFVHGDICDADLVRHTLEKHSVSGVIHLAAESHVDRSIADATAFVQTNVLGTVTLLEQVRRYWGDSSDPRFHHVSTDEVFGSLGPSGAFTEKTAYDPHSPYSASKASSDHFVRAWHDTYGLPTVITNCSNNYGPFQFPEKLIPLAILRAMERRRVPVYGRGVNVRDWLYVEDHCDAIALIFEKGVDGDTYCIGGNAEIANIDLVETLLDEIDQQSMRPVGTSRDLVEFVDDRPGHDLRYAMDTTKIENHLGWRPSVSLPEGLSRTVSWYLANTAWLDSVVSGEYRSFEQKWYVERTGEDA